MSGNNYNFPTRLRQSAQRAFCSALALALVCLPVRAYVYQYADAGGQLPLRWPSGAAIVISFSSSLGAPPANIKAGSDVVGAARRALTRWSEATNLQFVESGSGAQNISPSGAPDGVNLITVAQTPENAALFAAGSETTGRARVFFNPANGVISESDVTINPSLQYSTDGTPGTYDLESTFVHELGHSLGLDHSALTGSTMQPQQGRNGNYNLPAVTTRTLTEDDRAGARSLYGAASNLGVISGAVISAGGAPVFGAHVWAESLASGRVAGGTLTRPDGTFSIGGLHLDEYRVVVEYLNGPIVPASIAAGNRLYANIGAQPQFLAAEAVATPARQPFSINLNLSVAAGSPSINPRFFGVNEQLSTSAVSLAPGQTYRFYLGGEGVDRIPASGIASLSPFVVVDPQSLRAENFGASFPVVSFNLRVADNAHVSNYSLRFRGDNNETAYLAGVIAVDPYTDQTASQPIYENGFFVRQQYRDFLTREPETDGFNTWVGVLSTCPNVFNSLNCDRTHVSSSFFRSDEFEFKGFFVYRFYAASFGRRPSYAEMIPDMVSVTGSTGEEVIAKRNDFAANWVNRPNFRGAFDALNNANYVDRLLANVGVTLATPDPAVGVTRAALVAALDGGTKTRAQVLRDVVESRAVYDRQYNSAFVTMQYFGYLRRDPDGAGYDDWFNYLNANSGDYRAMVSGFVNSTEYRLRFGLQ